jgi:hypothetical protein
MSAIKELNQQAMQSIVNEFAKTTVELYDGCHAYNAGYFESQMMMMFAHLPATKQRDYISIMQSILSKKQQELTLNLLKKAA